MGQNLLRLYKHHLDSIRNFQGSHLLSLHQKILSLKSPRLIDVDELLVSQTGGNSPLWPFKSAMDYYKHASSDHLLPQIRVPYLAINAEDDPIVRVIPKPGEEKGEAEASPYVAVVVTAGGGHLGWFEDDEKKEIRRWVKKPVLEWLRAIVEEFVRDGTQEGGRNTELVNGFTREIGRESIGYREIEENDLPRVGPDVEGLTKGL